MKSNGTLFDTSVIISLERNQLILKDVLLNTDRPVLCSMVYAEVMSGIAQDANRVRATHNQKEIEKLKSMFDFVDFGEREAIALAELRAFVRREGKKRGKYDLIIAATAVANNLKILTHDRAAKFWDLPGVKVIEV